MRTVSIGLVMLLTATLGKAAAPPDQTLYTTYTLGQNSQSIGYLVCGSTVETFGCYTSGSLGPFGRVGAVIQGHIGHAGDFAVRDIYVIDVASGTGGTGVTLSVWRKTDTVSASSDSVQVEFVRSVPLPLTGGALANCYVVGTTSFLYIGTDQGGTAVQVRKSNYELNPIGGGGGGAITSITATDEGYVAISYGGPNEIGAGFQSFDPTGAALQVGGGYSVFLNSRVGLSTFNIPLSTGVASPQLLEPLARRAAAAPSSSTTVPPVTLYTDYSFESESQAAPAFNWVLFADCGSTLESSGCFGAGSLGPFGNVGAALVGPQVIGREVLTRHLYVLDSAGGKTKNEVILYDYLKTDTYNVASDSVSVSDKLLATVTLPLTGGLNVPAFMGASGDYLYVGTNASDGGYVQVHTGSLSVNQFGGFSPPIPLSSITSDDYGYVSLVSSGSQFSGYYLVDKQGQGDGDGGGVAYLLNSLVGINAETLPP